MTWRLALPLVILMVAAGASVSLPRTGEHASSTDRAARASIARDTVTPAQVALGDSIFHGAVAGAICATCHGTDASGVPGMGPDLTDGEWLHGDGGLAFLSTIISSGVMEPKKSSLAMPPYGGTPLTSEQLQAVAAYVWSLSRKTGG